MRTLLAVTLAVAACGEPGDATPDGGRPDAPPGCTRPDLGDGVQAYLTDVIARIPAPRATTAQRLSARTFLADELAALGWQPQTQAFANGANVFATIPATFGEGKQVIVGAHFDTVAGSPGANDNASGTAVVLAVARYLRDTPCRTAPVVVAFFDLEEAGLFGSRAFAQSLSPADVRAVHTIDQVAWDEDGDRRFELEQPTPALEAEWRAAAAVVGAPLTTVSTGGTDHESFRDRGFAAVGLTEEFVGGDTSPLRHLPGDTPQSIAPFAAYTALAAKLAGQVILDEVSP
ncbi:MAG: Zn-dependent exopeptidase M28 [Deltaproteobacteria bacterium]|nr:Zn-dependent exopeptidase M28 [Deltaproteobacteria bacterium]